MRQKGYVTKFQKIKEQLVSLLFPRRCPICDEVVLPGKYICPDCRKMPRIVREPRCLICGKHLERAEEEYCRDCGRKRHFFRTGRALYEYGSIAGSMYRFKYAGRQEYGAYYGKMIAKNLGGVIRAWSPDVLVPVPIHYTRHAARGYNQAEVLADIVGRELGIPVDRRLLKRVKRTAPQKLLSDRARQNNVENAFRTARKVVKYRTIVVIDDIYTTGSTVDACAAVLRRAGAERVYYIAIAIGRETNA